MKSSNSFSDDDTLHFIRRDRISLPTIMNMPKFSPFFCLSLITTSMLGFFILYYSANPFTNTPPHPHHQLGFSSLHHQHDDEQYKSCDLFKGRWVPDINGSLYSNWSCSTIPESKNCFKNGRRDADFVSWKWAPDQCDLPRFDPGIFLETVRGKKMAFIGDSLARNHMESLLCLLSQEEVPVDIFKDSGDRFRTWQFTRHNFTLMILWSKFLVMSKERLINNSSSGVFDLQLDRADDNWAAKLSGIDFAIISDAHWFFRKIYLHEGGNMTGCVYCSEPGVTDLGLSFALRMSFRAALSHINRCSECGLGMTTLLRTFSPAHFENGTWDNGGSCNRTSPRAEEGNEFGRFELELRSIQVEELERVRRKGKRTGKRFEALDITRAMLMRPDGHPGSYWGNKWMKGYDDCVHWCLPGPIDVWNDLLMAILKKNSGFPLKGRLA